MELSIRAGWSMGFYIGGGGGFSQALRSSSSYTLNSVEIYYSGQDIGTGIRGLTIEQGDAELTNFGNIA